MSDCSLTATLTTHQAVGCAVVAFLMLVVVSSGGQFSETNVTLKHLPSFLACHDVPSNGLVGSESSHQHKQQDPCGHGRYNQFGRKTHAVPADLRMVSFGCRII